MWLLPVGAPQVSYAVLIIFKWFYPCLRSKVYTPWPRNLDELEANIRREVNQLDPAMMTRALGDMKKRAQLCLAANGGHFEKWSPEQRPLRPQNLFWLIAFCALKLKISRNELFQVLIALIFHYCTIDCADIAMQYWINICTRRNDLCKLFLSLKRENLIKVVFAFIQQECSWVLKGKSNQSCLRFYPTSVTTFK